jgi:hypothetical protein
LSLKYSEGDGDYEAPKAIEAPP